MTNSYCFLGTCPFEKLKVSCLGNPSHSWAKKISVFSFFQVLRQVWRHEESYFLYLQMDFLSSTSLGLYFCLFISVYFCLFETES